METEMTTRELEKKALNLYVSLASVVFTASLMYCYLTNHIMEMSIVFAAVSILSFIVINTYKSFHNR